MFLIVAGRYRLLSSLIARFEVGIVNEREGKGLESNAKRGVLPHKGLEFAYIDARKRPDDLKPMVYNLIFFLNLSNKDNLQSLAVPGSGASSS